MNFEKWCSHLELSVVLFFGFSKPWKCFKFCQNHSILLFWRALPQAKIGLKSPQKSAKKGIFFLDVSFSRNFLSSLVGHTFFVENWKVFCATRIKVAREKYVMVPPLRTWFVRSFLLNSLQFLRQSQSGFWFFEKNHKLLHVLKIFVSWSYNEKKVCIWIRKNASKRGIPGGRKSIVENEWSPNPFREGDRNLCFSISGSMFAIPLRK